MDSGLTQGRVAVFCSSSLGTEAGFAELAADLGRRLADEGIGVVFGGGRVGLMGVMADAAMAAGGEVIGVIPNFLDEIEVAHQGLTELHLVADMHERKQLMYSLSDGFCARCRGGWGPKRSCSRPPPGRSWGCTRAGGTSRWCCSTETGSGSRWPRFTDSLSMLDS